ncbi:acyl carrier protein [Kitasatospora sp. NBC_01287]|uniref:acyl carrier protein n=1 Tax=Kitasatospora sp. NBC_01287 TaxID=2903573 RepID=UPI0022516C06|nr:acyl carrier protein [Kitasatospora sp. NBC_01287]MCX4743984.1 acyl carrier protein [Kitasatospora sp. NBC_01287]
MDQDEIVRLIGAHTVEVLPELADHTFVPSDELQELGADSVDRAEIVSLVLESLALDIPRAELFGPQDIGELAERLAKKLADA